MKTHSFRSGYAILICLTLMTTASSGTAVAQAPDDPGGSGNSGPGGGFGGSGAAGGRSPDANSRVRPSGRPPFTFGTVSAVDANAGTITVTSPSGGSGGSNSQVIKVSAGAQFVTQSEVAAADLKVGDQVQVRGLPTGITVS